MRQTLSAMRPVSSPLALTAHLTHKSLWPMCLTVSFLCCKEAAERHVPSSRSLTFCLPSDRRWRTLTSSKLAFPSVHFTFTLLQYLQYSASGKALCGCVPACIFDSLLIHEVVYTTSYSKLPERTGLVKVSVILHVGLLSCRYKW